MTMDICASPVGAGGDGDGDGAGVAGGAFRRNFRGKS